MQNPKLTKKSSRVGSNGITSPVRSSDSYHLGVLHQKRKASAKASSTLQSSSTSAANSNQHTAANNKAPQFKTIQNPLPSAYQTQSLSLKNFVEARNLASQAQAYKSGTTANNNNQVAFRPSRPRDSKIGLKVASDAAQNTNGKQMIVACQPDSYLISPLVYKELTNNSSQLSQRATLKKRRSEQELTQSSSACNSNGTTPVSSVLHGKNSAATIAKQASNGVMRCQLNKGIRNLLKSKSQSNYRKVNKRQPLGEVNNNVADSTVSNQTPNPDQANVEPAGEDATHINILAHANNFLDNTSLNLHHNAPLQGDDDTAPVPEMPTCLASNSYDVTLASPNTHVAKLPNFKPLNQKILQKVAKEEAPDNSDMTMAQQTVKNNDLGGGPVFSSQSACVDAKMAAFAQR